MPRAGAKAQRTSKTRVTRLRPRIRPRPIARTTTVVRRGRPDAHRPLSERRSQVLVTPHVSPAVACGTAAFRILACAAPFNYGRKCVIFYNSIACDGRHSGLKSRDGADLKSST